MRILASPVSQLGMVKNQFHWPLRGALVVSFKCDAVLGTGPFVKFTLIRTVIVIKNGVA